MTQDQDLSEKEFVKRAIKQLREPPEKGIHTKYSGFKEAFKEYFDKDPFKVLEKLKKRGEIVTKPAKDGFKLYLPKDAPEKNGAKQTIEKIVSSASDEESSKDKQTSKENKTSTSKKEKHSANQDSSRTWIPLVIDEEGAHETTEYALTSGPKRVWLKGFTDGGRKIKLKSVYLSKEDVKKMDRVKTDWSWNGDSKSWEINADSLAYVLDHFVNMDYDVAISPSLSHLVIEDLPLEVEYLQIEQDEERINYDVQTDDQSPPQSKEKESDFNVKDPTDAALDDQEFIQKAKSHIEKPMSKLTPLDVVDIWDRLESEKSYDSIADDYPISSETVNQIKAKSSWSWLTSAIQTGNPEKYKGILATLNYLIIFKKNDDKIDEDVLRKSMERVESYDLKLSPLDVIDIWERLELWDTTKNIAKDYPVKRKTITVIKTKKNRRWLTNELTVDNSRIYKRLLEERLIEEGILLENAEVRRHDILEKEFVKKAWNKVREYSIDLLTNNVIKIWEELQHDTPIEDIAKKYQIDKGQIRRIREKESYTWLTRKLEEGETAKYKGMLIALEHFKQENSGKEESEEKDEYEDQGEIEQGKKQGGSRSKEVFKSVKSRYILDDLEGHEDEVESDQSNKERDGKEIEPGDVVEHSLGMRGEVQKIEGETLLVKLGPQDSRKWKEGVCTFVKEGR